MSVARFIADQRTKHAVPHAFTCRVLEFCESWFYKWIKDPTTVRAKRRAELDEAVRVAFASERAHGSPRLHLDLTEPEPAQDGTTPPAWRVGENTVAESMRRQGQVARGIRRRCGLTRQDKCRRRTTRPPRSSPTYSSGTSPSRHRTSAGSAT